MISIDILTVGFWENLSLSNKRFCIFTEDYTQRTTASGVPELIAFLAESTPIIAAYRAEINLLDSYMTSQRVSTFNKNEVLIQFKEEVRGLEGAVIDIFKGKKSLQYSVEFFQHGLGEYTNVVEPDAEVLFNRLKLLTTKYVLELGAPRKLIFEQLAAAFISTHKIQQLAKGSVTKCSGNIKTNVKEVKDIMFRNVLLTAAHYYKTPIKVLDTYREALLHCQHTNLKGTKILKAYKPEIKTESILLADYSYKDTDKLLFEDLGEESLFWFTTDVELETLIIPDDANELFPQEELIVEASTLKKFLYIGNKSTTKIGKLQLSTL